MRKILSVIQANPFKLIRKVRTARRKLFFVILPILAIGGPFVFIMLTNPNSALGAWWNNQWQFRKLLSFENAGSADGNKKVLFEVDTTTLVSEGKMQNDCGDVRFTDNSGNLLKYFLDSENGPCNPSTANGGPTKIDDAGDPGAMIGSDTQIVKTSTGTLYAFINDGGICEMWKSSDGSAWTEQDTTAKPACLSGNSISIAIDGTDTLHLLYFDDLGGGEAIYNTFSTSTDQFGSEEIAIDPSGNRENNLKIILDSNDAPHVVISTYVFGDIGTIDYSNRIAGSWKSKVIVETGSAAPGYIDATATISEDDIVEIIYQHASLNWLIAAVGNVNDASSFTTQTIDSATITLEGISTAIDSSGNTWVAYIDENGASDYITIIKHNDADAWTTWQTPITNSNVGNKPSLAVNSTDIYIFYEDENDDIKYDMYNGSTWLGENNLHSGTYQNVKVRWSYYNNNKSALQLDYLYSDGTDVYWASLNISDGTTDFYVLMPSIPAGTNNVYMYYGNPSAPNGTESTQFSQDTFSSGTITEGTEEYGPAPVGYWKFDEGQGQIANDTQGNDHGQLGSTTGSDTDDPTWKPKSECVRGRCLSFDGTDDSIEIGDNTSFEFTDGSGTDQPFTISAWVRMTDFSTNQTIMSKYDNNNAGREYQLYFGTNKLHLRIYGGTSIYIERNAPFTSEEYANRWVHIVATYDGSEITDGVKIYIDGIRTDDTADSGGSYAGMSTTSAPLRIGSRFVGGVVDTPFKGYIDEPKIYSYELSANQTKADYTGGGATLGSVDHTNLSNGLVGYWKMDESSWSSDCSTTEVLDSTGHNLHARSCPSGDATDPTTGKFGNAGTFDGTNDYLTIPASSDGALNLQTISIAAWTYSADYAHTAILFEKTQAGSSTQYSCHITNAGDIVFRTYNTADTPDDLTVSQSTAGIINNQWNHLVCQYNGSTKKIYVNGVEAGTKDYSETLRTGNVVTGTSYIGRLGGASAFYFNGKLDDLRVYNRGLAPNEIAQLYAFAPGPVLHFQMEESTWVDDCSTGTVLDTSGNNKHAKSCASGSGPKGGVRGKVGRAGYFDGTDDYLQVNSPNLPTKDFTIMAWTKIQDTSTSHYVFSSIEDATSGLEFTVRYNSLRRVEVKLNGVNAPSTTTNRPEFNEWTHLTIRREGSTVTVFFNGIPDPTTGSDSTELNFGTCAFMIGVRATGTGNECTGSLSNFLKGNIDDVRVYNYARTQQQIIQDMNGGHPVGGSPISSQLGYWKMDEGTGSTLNNSGFQGSVINGTISGATWTNNGKIKKALEFDGADDYVNLGSDSSIDDVSQKTISAWIYPQTLGEGDNGQIFYKTQFRVKLNANNQLVVRQTHSTTTGIWETPHNAITLNTWNHIAVSYDNTSTTNNPTVYINGIAQTLTESSTPVGTASSDASSTAYIGNDDTGTQTFDGYIDELKLYNSVLSTDQIKTELSGGKSVRLGTLGTDASGNPSNSADRAFCPPGDTTATCGPIGYWGFEEKTGQNITDKSGNGNNGTIGNTAIVGGDDPTWSNGKIGTGLRFDGVDDYVMIPTTSSLEFSGSFTVNTWVNTTGLNNTNQSLFMSKESYGNTGWVLADNGQYGSEIFFRVMPAGQSGCGTGMACMSRSLVNDGKWHLITGVYDGSTLKLYLDGKLQDSRSSGTFTVNTTDGVTVGMFLGSGGGGSQDEIKIYNYARSPAQIAWDYDFGKPVLQYKFDECSGSTIFDSSGNGKQASITIGALGSQTQIGSCSTSGAWANGVTGKRNYSLNFDGNDDYIAASSTTIMAGDTATYTNGSWGGWIRPTSSAASITMMLKGSEFELSTDASGNPQCRIYSGSWQSYVTASATLSLNTWTHLMCVYDGTNLKLYVNGIQAATGAQTASITSTASSNYNVGRSSVSGGQEYVTGQIDDVQIYNYPLSQQQIRNVMNGGAVRWGPVTGAP